MPITNFFQLITENQVEFVDFRFTDQLGKWHHISYNASQINEAFLKNGVIIELLNLGKIILIPDLITAFLDPFTSLNTLVVICDIIDINTKKIFSIDPRSTAKKAEKYLIDSNIKDPIFFGVELEFFIFDEIRFETLHDSNFVKIDSEESPAYSGKKIKAGNYGHRSMFDNGLMSVQPIDSLNDIRSEISMHLKSIGLDPLSHNHGDNFAQSKIAIAQNSLLISADNIQKFKYITHNAAHSYGKTATFMPKPIKDKAGSSMKISQNIHHSKQALYYLGGIIRHIKVINAFTNSATNSYKRLNFDNMLDYCKLNEEAIIETKFPDGLTNPYYGLASMLMAGIEGIINKIDPHLEWERNKGNFFSKSLDESIDELAKNSNFLKKNNVFSDEEINSYIALKQKELKEFNSTPSPVEFKLYYSS